MSRPPTTLAFCLRTVLHHQPAWPPTPSATILTLPSELLDLSPPVVLADGPGVPVATEKQIPEPPASCTEASDSPAPAYEVKQASAHMLHHTCLPGEDRLGAAGRRSGSFDSAVPCPR